MSGMDLSSDEVKSKPKEETPLSKAAELENKSPDQAIAVYRKIIEQADPKNLQVKTKEDAISKLAKLYSKLGRLGDLKKLLVDIRPLFSTLPKAKTAKIVRNLIDSVGETNEAYALQAEMCQQAIEWCVQEKRTFLKQRMQARLASLYLSMQKFKDALAVISKLVREVRKFDDKLLLVEIQLIESRVHHALLNIPKAKGALTSARSAANAIYCPPLLQAQIDLQAGILCGEEKDFKTAFSYFYEAFEGYNTMTPPSPKDAVMCLKYMLLAKIMTNNPEDVYSIINGKAGLKYAGVEVEAMREVANAYKKRSIHEFERIYKSYKAQLHDDLVVFRHLDSLRSNLLEQNLIRLIEPFSRVQIAHVAKLIDLPRDFIEAKLSSMILDKKLSGILDQGSGDLIVFEETGSDKTYTAALDTVKEMNSVLDRLYIKAKRLTTS